MIPRPSLDRQATSALGFGTRINGKGLSLPSSVRKAFPALFLPIMLSSIARKPYPLLLAANQRLFAGPQAAVTIMLPEGIST
jgi:hypothetical protein